jgi:hypothetical protein
MLVSWNDSCPCGSGKEDRFSTSDLLAHPTHRKNPATAKLNGVDDFVVSPCQKGGKTALLSFVPLAPQGLLLVPCSSESNTALSGTERMSRIHRECPDSDPSDWLVMPAEVPLRQEPDEEDDGKEKEDDEDDDEETDDGYSE